VIVLDASAAVEFLLRTTIGQRARDMPLAAGDALHAPHLIDLEVAQTLRRFCLTGQIAAERGREALEDLLDLPLHRHRHDIFLFRIWELRNAVTAYDAEYLALAESLDAVLVTRDAALADVRYHRARVEVLR